MLYLTKWTIRKREGITLKILSIVVPCYNSAAYMDRCVQSLLLGGSDVEIILVDDGSKDKTPEKIDNYQARYPGIITAVHQENGGHGQAVNTGIEHATGHYVRVVDSDDWLDGKAFPKVMEFLRKSIEEDMQLDMLITNYMYDKQNVKHKKIMQYRKCVPTNCIFTWEDTHFPFGKYLLMHSVIYRTTLVRDEAKLKLPAHTFYVDNLYVFEPLQYVKNMYYLDVTLYHYFIGREDQSVNEKVMIGRIDQQIFVNKRMIDYYTDNVEMKSHIGKYMEKYIEVITSVSSILLIRDGSREALNKKKELWHYIKEKNPKLYHKLMRGALGMGLHLPGKLGRRAAVDVYRMARKIYGFN